MKIVFISRWYPYPPDNGSRIRIFNLIKQLSSRHEVDLISFTSEPLTGPRLESMHRYCRHIKVVPYQPFQPTRRQALGGFFSSRPRSMIDTYSLELQEAVEQAHREHTYDLAIASQIDMVLYTTALPQIPKIFEELELTTLYERVAREQHPLKKLRGWITWWKLSRFLAAFLTNFDGCTVVSEAERQRVLETAPNFKPVRVIPNGVDIASHIADYGPPVPDTLIYSGALTYGANFDAMAFFIGEVLPLIQAERPQVKLYITGKLDGVPVDRLPQNEGVVFTGYLDDIRSKIAQSWVSVVPLRLGGGTRLKILEALAIGTPVVATSKGAEGLDLVPDRDVLLANEPGDFAKAVLRLLGDESLRKALKHNGQSAAKKYDWQTIGQDFCDFIEEAAAVGVSV